MRGLSTLKADILPLLWLREDAPEEMPLSKGQEALWFIHHHNPRSSSSAYNVAVATARGRSPVDTGLLRQAYQGLLNRHSVLRAVFGERDGSLLQTIQPFQRLDFQEEDVIGLSEEELFERVMKSYRLPFSLESGPLFRVRLFRRAPDDWMLLATAHHIVLDGWSVGHLTKEFTILLESLSNGTTTQLAAVQSNYGKFVRWQRDWLAGPEAECALAYWQQHLEGELPVLSLPQAQANRLDTGGALEAFRFVLDRPLLDPLRKLAHRQRVTLFSLLLAAFQTLLHRKRPALPPVIVRKKPSSSAFLRRTINGFISTLETTYRGVAGQWPVASRILSAARA